MYELVYGSIFDKKCDIIIVPCNSMGGLTKTIEKDLIINGISNNPTVNIAGQIAFSVSRGSFTNALVIGFATLIDVLTGKSKTEYLENICKEIIDYCKGNALSLVNIPLHGTEVGGLSSESAFKILRSHFENESGINLRIFTNSKDTYFRLTDDTVNGVSLIKNPRIFISYTGENPENRKWVKNLACKLRKNGVNARVDIFHLKPGYDLPQWMTNELLMADKVLLICDSYYAQKADSRNGGVGWETMIIQGDMMNHTQSDKYICITREENIDDGIPIYAKTKFSLHWTNKEIPEEDFRELMYHLFDCDVEPKVEDIPEYIKDIKNRN